MKTITLKTHYGNHLVTVNGKVTVFATMFEAVRFISKERGFVK